MLVVRVRYYALRFRKLLAAFLLTISLASVAYGQALTVTPNPVDFGQVRIGNEGELEVTITANDPSGVGIDDVYVDGEQDGSPFIIFSDPTENCEGFCYLEQGESLSFYVYFYPETLGEATDDLVIQWGLGNANPKNKVMAETLVPLIGEGQSSISISPNPLDFGRVIIGSTVTMDLEIVSEVSYDVSIVDIYVDGSNSPFSTDDTGGFILSFGESAVIEVSFQPQSTGSFLDNLVVVTELVSSKASALIENRMVLRGRGMPQPVPSISVNPLMLDFGVVQVGENDVKNLTISNVGTDELVVESLAIVDTGAGLAGFTVQGGGFLLAPNASRLVPVTFAPTMDGLVEAAVRITSNDPNSPVIDVPVTGTGEDIEIEVDDIDFGTVVVGEVATSEVVLENPGQSALNMSVGIFDDATGSFSAVPESFVLSPGGSQTITFTFAPQDTGPVSAAVLIESEGSPIAFTLAGEGVAPNIVVQNRSLNFGTVALGTSATRQVTVSNVGDSDLLISDTQISGGNGQFAVTAMGGPQVVPPEGSYVIEVTFTSTLDGPQSATLSILSNDPDEPSLDVALAGTSSCALMTSRPSIPFGDVLVGEAATEEVVVSHSCASTIEVEVAVSGQDAFSVDPQGILTIAAGVSQTLTVTFQPTGGDQAAILNINDRDLNGDDGPLAAVMVSLTGSGLEPDLVLEAEQVDFGVVTLGRTALVPFVLTNTGTADLTLSSLTIGGDNPAAFQVEDASASTLAPGATRTLNLIFNPMTSGARAAVLRITSNDPDTPQRNLALRGNGMAVQSDAPTTADNDTATPVSFQVPTDLQSASGQLFYRRGGEPTYTSTPLTTSGTAVAGQIPAAFVTPRGVQYYAEFDLNGETITFPAPDQPLQLRVRVASVSPQETRSDFTLPPADYRMVSIPLVLDDPSVATQFGDDYGPLDPNVWRMSRWNPGGEVYQEYTGASRFNNAGVAAWLVTNSGEGFDVENGVSQDLSGPVDIVLEPGWNQIGNPFLFEVAWSAVLNNSAVAAPGLYFHDGDGYVMGAPRLQPWDGYFVFNPSETQVTISVPPVAAGVQAAKQASDEAPFPAASYLLQLRADVPEQGLHDTQNFIGFSAEARSGRDDNDWLEAPGVGRHLRMSVIQDGQPFASALKPLGAQGGTWDLELDVSAIERIRTRATTVQVTLIEQGVRPEGFEMYIMDMDEGRVLPASEGTFSLTLPVDQPLRHLRVVIGTEAFAETESQGVSLVPVDYALEANYPNPFNPETVIRYSLNARSTVELAIFNVLGQRVRTLVQAEQTSGHYEVRWDGHDAAGQSVASGVYIYRLQADGFVSSRKMLLLR